MKRALACGVFFLIALTLGCGKSLSDADKKTAQQSIGALMSKTSTSLMLAEKMKAIATQKAQEMTLTSGCTPSGPTTSSGVTVTITCPSGTGQNSYKFVMTADSFTASCGSSSLTIAALTATITITTATGSFSYGFGISANVNSKAFACNFSASFSTGGSGYNVDSANYSCTYDGADVGQDAMAASYSSCST
jgi:hypothetical protein